MRKHLLACGAAAAAIAGATAPAAAEGLSVETTVGFESRYVFRGVQFAETSFQPAITLGYEGFYVGVWTNLPVGDDDLVVTPGGEEIDYFGGFSTEIAPSVEIDVGVTFYTFPDVASGWVDLYKEDQGVGTNTVETYLGFSFDTLLSPSIYFYRDFSFETFTVEGSMSHSFPIDDKWSFDVGGSLGYVVDDDAGADYLYGAATADLSYAFSDSASFSAGVRYGGSDIAGGSIIDDSIAGTWKSSGFWWGVGFTSSF